MTLEGNERKKKKKKKKKRTGHQAQGGKGNGVASYSRRLKTKWQPKPQVSCQKISVTTLDTPLITRAMYTSLPTIKGWKCTGVRCTWTKGNNNKSYKRRKR